MSSELSCSVEPGVSALPAADWDALVPDDDPFLEHAFLAALESSASVGPRTGWTPRTVVARAGRRLVGAVPLYLKTDSYGEFVFDWSWASAAQRAGIRYYPKLVAAVPYTPVTGRRILVHPGVEPGPVTGALLEAVHEVADEDGASSVHFLFCTAEESELLGRASYLERLSFQFHWQNRPDPPYRDFEDFLSAFRAPSRKQVRKERQRVAGHGLEILTHRGTDLGAADWRALEGFYRRNVDRHGGTAYLTDAFFEVARATLAARVLTVLAYRGRKPVAGSLNFERGRHLYGRYWGSIEDHDLLHFELCYYRLIDRAIERGHLLFEAGAQGEHKLKRGLLPCHTHSAHWIRHAGLRRALAGVVTSEAALVREHALEYGRMSPFARGPRSASGA